MARRKRFTRVEQERRVAQILRGLDQGYPNAQCALEHKSALELLVATILSAPCTDERVNIVTRAIFKRYRTPEDYVNAPRAVLEEEIRSTGFFRNKTKSLQRAAAMILDEFAGRGPETMETVIAL